MITMPKSKAAEPKAAKKAPAKKTSAKKASKKPVKAAEPKTSIVLEYQGRQLVEADLLEQAKKLWADAGKTEAIAEMNLYVKPEDGAVYCVINGETMGSFEI